ncbi:hypothetical protein QBC35DRAFT_498210 [Podospora australis]|uniref:Uncharacterized protein n=1 Tax=Podospora australis TaxID=1536484 RepID=A0AAN6WUQ0_9PEZI|nr:hypothetical protein QBC35DRAFT_498210 [Podospora australis]
MSFGLSPSDIKEALKICKWFWDNHFDQENSSDERYKQLVGDLKDLDGQTTRLETCINRAINELYPIDRDGAELRRELAEITGNFLDTLQKCKTFLNKPDHIKLQRRRGNIIDNVVWGLNAEGKADKLRAQIHFHIQRMELINKEVQDDLLRAILQEISRLSEWTVRGAPDLETQAAKLVPTWLRIIFTRNFSINRPPTVFDPSPANMPLGLGCDILHKHYESRNTPDHARLDPRAQTVYFYLALLKCQWIINTLRQGSHFLSYRPGSPFRRFILNMELEIFQELQRLMQNSSVQVRDQELQDLLEENNEPFLIWTPPKIRRVITPIDPEEGEQELFSVSLDGGETLLIFKKGSSSFRLVPAVEQKDGQMTLSQHFGGPVRIHTDAERLIPLYTISQPDTILFDIYQKRSRDRLMRLEMRALPDAWALQRALTGYEVLAHEPGVTWISQQNIGLRKILADSRKEKMDAGCVQIWKWGPAPEKPQPDLSVKTGATTSSSDSGSTVYAPQCPGSDDYNKRYSLFSQSPPSQRASMAMSYAGSMMSTASRVSTVYTEYVDPQGKQTEVGAPTPPVIVFYGQTDDNYVIYHLELSPTMVIKESKCTMCSKPATEPMCPKLYIQSTTGSSFTIRRLSVSDNHPQNWNLFIFRGPRHAKEYNDKTLLSQTSCDYLSLNFPSPALRRDFTMRFKIAMGEYIELYNQYVTIKEKKTHEGDRPAGSMSSGRLGSQYSRASVLSSPRTSTYGTVTPRASTYGNTLGAQAATRPSWAIGSLPVIGSKMSIAEEFLSPGARKKEG